MKRRVISLALMVCLLLQSLCMIASAEITQKPTPAVSQETLDAKDFLTKLGVIGEDFEVNGVATKSSFLCLALAATKTEPVSAEKQIFSDVPLSYYAVDEITTAYNTGYIKGNGNGTFSPDKIVNVNEALSIVMNILNYGHLQGTSSYQIIINKQDLLKNVEVAADGTINNGAALVLLKNMLLAEYNMLTGVSGDAGIYKTDEYTTLLYVLYSIIRDEGLVTAVDEIYLDGHAAVKQGYMALNDIVIEDEEGLANDLLGYYTEVYVIEDEGSYSLFEINETTRRNEELILDAEDLTNKSTASKIVYINESDKEETITLAPDFTLIYNGRNYNGFTNDIFRITQGKIRLVANNGGDYTLVYVYEYENYIVKNINYGDEKIYLENSATVIDYSDPEDVVLLDADGEPASGEDLYAGLVLTVYKSRGGNEFLTVKAGRGDYIMVPDGMDDEYIYMGEEKVRMTAAVIARKAEIKLGTKAVFALDAFGDAVDFEHVSTGVMYGYLVDVELLDDSFGEEIYGMKIFTENNEMVILTTDEYLKVNDSKLETATAISGFVVAGVCHKQLIRFTATDDNIIKEIWKCTDKSGQADYVGYDEDNFTLDYVTGTTFQYRGGNNSIDTKYIVNGKTLRFIIPSTGDDEDYRCTTCASGLDANITSGVRYQLFDSSKERVASVLLEESSTGISDFSNSSYQTPVVVSELSRAVNDEGTEVLVVKGYMGNEEIRYITDDEEMADAGETCDAFNGIKASQLQCGDVVQFNVSGSDNEIQAMRILYRRTTPLAYDEKGFGNATVNERDYYGWLYASSAKVLEQYDNIVIAHTNRNATTAGTQTARNRVVPFTDSTVFYVYDSARNKLTKTDSLEYMIDKNIFFTASLSTVRMVVIYK